MVTTCNLPYTLAFRIPISERPFIRSCQRKLNGLFHNFVPSENTHLTVKFLGHSKEFFDEDALIELIPEIARIAKKHIPLKIFVRGFDLFHYEEGKSPVIFLKVMPNDKLMAFHNELIETLGKKIQTFDFADASNYQPHITLSKNMLIGSERKLSKVIYRSKKGKKRLIKLDDLVVLTPNRMFPVSENLKSPFICPPLK